MLSVLFELEKKNKASVPSKPLAHQKIITGRLRGCQDAASGELGAVHGCGSSSSCLIGLV